MNFRLLSELKHKFLLTYTENFFNFSLSLSLARADSLRYYFAIEPFEVVAPSIKNRSKVEVEVEVVVVVCFYS